MIKKILPPVLIALIFANLFVPFSLDIKDSTPVVQKSVAEAGDFDLSLYWLSSTDHSIDIRFDVTRYTTTENHGLFYIVTDNQVSMSNAGLNELYTEIGAQRLTKLLEGSGGYPKLDYTKLFSVPANTHFLDQNYFTSGLALKDDGTPVQKPVTIQNNLIANKTYYVSYFGFSGTTADGTVLQTNIPVTTADTGKTIDNSKNTQPISRSIGQDGYMPSCWLGFTNGFISVPGCIAQVIYSLFFVPTSALFGIAGKFFDFTFKYSITDTSYRSAFVLQGWKIVKDFVNMFFIFVLLYIAFSTILRIHGFKTKEMIINVVIIGLLINFSLFATQVIIDTSNILARVFYNSSSIIVNTLPNKSATGQQTNQTNNNSNDNNGVIPLSVAIVKKVNPQRLILDAAKVGNVARDTGGQAGASTTNTKGIDTWTFILVTILASVTNIVGLFVFFTVGLIFVSRVIGLWLTMIFAPFAFFSYAVPVIQNVNMIGWKKWWPNLFKFAFLAPIFIFFMYLIIAFLGTNACDPSVTECSSSFLDISGRSGLDLIISIIVPFAFIIILLNMAKRLAVEFAGYVGSAVTKAAVVGGGLAIGGAALTTAFTGRQTVGAVAKYTQNDGARKNALRFQDVRDAASKIRGANIINPFAYLNLARKAVTSTGKASMAGIAAGFNKVGQKTDPITGKTTNWFQRREMGVDDKAHAEHELNQSAQKITGKDDSTYKDLTDDQKQLAQDRIDRDIYSKDTFNKVYEKLDVAQRGIVDGMKGYYDAATGIFTADPSGNFAHAAEIARGNAATRGEYIHTAGDMKAALEAGTAVGEFVRSLRKGSYDIRELAKTKPSGWLTAGGLAMAGMGGILPVFGLAMAASASSAIKKGLKSGLSGIDHGTAQKDFFKDLSGILSDSLKSINVDVKVDHNSSGSGKASGGGHH